MSNHTSDNELIVSATVTEALPNTMFRVRLNAPQKSRNSAPVAPTDAEPAAAEPVAEPDIIIAYLSGRMKLHRIKVLIGDTVQVLLDPYGGKGRIVKRG